MVKKTSEMGMRLNSIGACLILLLSCASLDVAKATYGSRVYNVNDYGAKCDGKTDNSKVFLKAWNDACALENVPAKFYVPEGTYAMGPIVFEGPCKNPITFELKGTLLAPTNLDKYTEPNWIKFHYLDGMLLTGGGKFDGQGASAWPSNKCKSGSCKRLPTNIAFGYVTNSTIQHVSSINSKYFHFHLFSCHNLTFEYLKVSAPGDSPNTDGMHIGLSTHITVQNSTIGTGDDCISLGPGSKNISITDVYCGPGHGISVGSLGKAPNEDDVMYVKVRNCTFLNTTNGVRIKTWQDSPSTSVARDMIFEDIVMKGVDHPVVIDQKYCPYSSCSEKKPSKVKISNVKFHNIRGKSNKKVAVDLQCSAAVPCQGIQLSKIDLNFMGAEANSNCSYAKGIAFGDVLPLPCF